MEYLITLLEGIISFISPCTLPLLPVYLAYLAGGRSGESLAGTAAADHTAGAAGISGTAAADRQPSARRHTAWTRPLGFVLGFTVVFCLLGLFAGALSALLVRHQSAVNIVLGLAVIFFGLAYLGVIPMRFAGGVEQHGDIRSFFSAFVFGMVYAVSLTPCTGAFLGSAIMLAASSGTALKGALLLFVYSLGLGIPFLLSALLIDQLTGTFNAIKRHYNVINKACGLFLIAVGILMACGLLGRWMALLL